jgi:hypothetical protein
VRSIVSAICLTLAAFSIAQADDPYTVTNVAIDASADNALTAQTEAMRQGQELAVHHLIERLTLEEDRFETAFDFTPRMNEFGEMVQDNALDLSVVAEMISGIEIQNEQRSATRYLADLTISFDPRVVERIFSNYGVPYVEAQSRPTMVLPIFNEGGQFLLWEDNVWREAWQAQNFSNALTPMFVPEEGEALLSARDALTLNEAALASLAGAYNVNRIAVLRAEERDGLRRFGGYLVSIASDGTFEVSTWGPENVFGGWRDAAARFVTERETDWKQQSIVRDLETEEFRVTVLYGGIGEWRSLQDALTGASLVEAARLDAMSRDGALMTVNFRGAREQLISELAERGAVLEEQPELGWIIRTAF